MKNRSLYGFCFCLGLLFCMVFLSACRHRADSCSVFFNQGSDRIDFAVREIEQACSQRGINLKPVSSGYLVAIILEPENEIIESEGFEIRFSQDTISVIASDEAGAMYGGLELAEQIRLYGFKGIKPVLKNPYMKMRGTKFNIPLDVRTPSYTDMSDVAQMNIPEMWNFDFWKEYIDNLARYRYNFISLWSLHPFPSMVKVPGYENIALNDVQRSSCKNFKEWYNGLGIGFCPPEVMKDPEILQSITIDEKIEFWKRVMDYGKKRNVDFYVMTWNIFLYGVDEKYGMTETVTDRKTIDYFRKSVKQIFVTYPELKGIGLSPGENMRQYNFKQKEEWAFNTYAQGVLDAAAEMPDRKITFIHRQHDSGVEYIKEKFDPLIKNENIDFIFSFKYAKAHVMSAAKQPYHETFIKKIGDVKTIWTLRNDDNYFYRWGAPDFVREFISKIPYDVSQGYYYGSDQWIWGRDFISRNIEGVRPIEIVKHKYHWMIWGRLGYDPEMSNERFVAILQDLYPEVDAGQLFTAWQEASMIYPVTTGFHWGSLDVYWYIEGCKGHPGFTRNKTGFHDVNRFISLPPHPKSGFQSIPDFVNMTLGGNTTEYRTPFEVAEILHSHADKSLRLLGKFNPGENAELIATLQDIKTMALLGKYYAFKISGSTHLALYRCTKDKVCQTAAIDDLEKALETWINYKDNAIRQNINPIWMNRVGYVDLELATQWAADDIEIAKKNLQIENDFTNEEENNL